MASLAQHAGDEELPRCAALLLGGLSVGLLLVSAVALGCAVCAVRRRISSCAAASHRAVARQSSSGGADGGSGTRRVGGEDDVQRVQVKALREEFEQLCGVMVEKEATLLLRIAALEHQVANMCLDSRLCRSSLTTRPPSTRTRPPGAPTAAASRTPSSGSRFDAHVVAARLAEQADGPSRVDRPRARNTGAASSAKPSAQPREPSTGAASSAQPRARSGTASPARMAASQSAASDHLGPSSESLFYRRVVAEQASGPSRNIDRTRARNTVAASLPRTANDRLAAPPTPISSRRPQRTVTAAAVTI